MDTSVSHRRDWRRKVHLPWAMASVPTNHTQPTFGWAWSLVGLLFGYTTFIAAMTMIVEVVKFMGTFLVLPAMANYKLLGEIMKCNAHSVAMLFGAMTK